MAEASNLPLKKTPLHALHVELGGRMVEFGGYDMPVQYPEGIMAEHNWTRTHAGLFDVSHMGAVFPCPAEAGRGGCAREDFRRVRAAGVRRCARAEAGRSEAYPVAERRGRHPR